MNILLALIPISLLLLGVAIWAFLAAVRGGQFDDLDTPALDMLRDEDTPLPARAGEGTGETHEARPPEADGAAGGHPGDDAPPR